MGFGYILFFCLYTSFNIVWIILHRHFQFSILFIPIPNYVGSYVFFSVVTNLVYPFGKCFLGFLHQIHQWRCFTFYGLFRFLTGAISQPQMFLHCKFFSFLMSVSEWFFHILVSEHLDTLKDYWSTVYMDNVLQ